MAASAFSENAVEKIKPSRSLTDLNAVLDDFEPLASKFAELEKEILDREAQALTVILERITPLVPALSKDYESYYRREIVIIADTETSAA